jgi:hypothetical protein
LSPARAHQSLERVGWSADRPYHLIGLELGISIANIVLRGEPSGATDSFRGDAVATAKRVLRNGDKLDGEGGYTVYGRLMPAADSLGQEERWKRSSARGWGSKSRLERNYDQPEGHSSASYSPFPAHRVDETSLFDCQCVVAADVLRIRSTD